jgi:hypothetical protein
MQPNKNGFLCPDREKGSLISAIPFTGINWATGVDSNGTRWKTQRFGMKDATIASPSTEGGHWEPISFNPVTGSYFSVLDSTCSTPSASLED